MKRVLPLVMRTLGLLVFAAAVGLAILAWQVDRLGRRDEVRPADAIVVLGARVAPDGQPGPDLSSRTLHGVALWKAGYSPYMICTGGFKNEPLSAAAVCKRLAVANGLPADRILLADGASNTVEDAVSAARVMAARGLRTAILVSHPLHLFRARWLFRRAGVDAVTSPTNTDVGRIDLPLHLWYTARETGAILVTALDGWNAVPPEWLARLQRWSYGVQ